MYKTMLRFGAICAISAGLIMSCSKEDEKPQQEVKNDFSGLAVTAKNIFAPLPDKMPGSDNDTPELVDLGKKLYFETALSANNTQSCNSCHNVDAGGVDNLATSPGAFGKNGDRNSPTVYNAGFHFAQFWDGRAADLKEQAKGPILNPVEMAMESEEAVVKKLSKIKEYQQMFKTAYPDIKKPITYDNIAHAIAAFERTLKTTDRFDDYLNGDDSALNDDEKAGLQLYVETGCNSCHSGALLGGNMFQKFGLVNKPENLSDMGRFSITNNEADKFFFKVPSLRNIELTAPYYHDGSVATLEEAVKNMAWLQLGKDLNDEQVTSITNFLKALTGKELQKNNDTASK